ncbi:MAG: flippase-like domain-containing protein [Methanothrix sp.]|nr:flippase-like domain-containing protein [Methanothrix sp.]
MANARWLFWILVAAFLWLMVSHLTEIKGAALPLIQGQPEWILLAALLQVLYYALFAAIFKSAFYTVDIKSRIRDLIPVTLGALFINVVAPTWGMAGAALYVDDASHRGESPARAAAGTVLAQTADFSAFALILAGGIAYLSIRNRLESYEIAATAFLFVILCSLAITLILGLWRPILLMKLLGLTQSGINRLAKKVHRSTVLPDGWAARNAADFSNAAKAMEAHPKMLALTLGIALVAHLVNIISLYALFLAFHQQIEFGPLVAGYAMGILFWNISPVPQGIGVVEGVMALVYTSLGIHGVIAALIVLAFRGLNFWLPMLLGFILLRRVKILKPKHEA